LRHRCTGDRADDLRTGYSVCDMRVASVHFSAGPLLRRSAGYDAPVGARLPRQSAPAGEPVAHPAGPGIVIFEVWRHCRIEQQSKPVATRATRIR
jgi:hypothetical protein